MASEVVMKGGHGSIVHEICIRVGKSSTISQYGFYSLLYPSINYNASQIAPLGCQ